MYYKYFYYLLIKISISKVFGIITVVDKGISPLEKNSVGIKYFVDIENESRVGTCKVYSKVKKCCLTDLDEEDCSTMYAIGETIDVIKPRDRKTLIYVIPTLCPYGLVGYCDVMIDYRCSKNWDRLHVNIPFDTTIANSRHRNPLLKSYLDGVKNVICETLDQNSLNNCSPIDCDIKYSGKRSFYDKDINRCIKIPICVGDVNKELSSVVYVPHVNVCKDLECPVTSQDIYAITSGLGTVIRSPIKEDHVRFEFKSNCTTISQNLYLLRDLLYGRLCPCDVNFEELSKSAVLAIVFCVFSICAIILSFIFCVKTIAWIFKQWAEGNIKAFIVKVRRNFKRIQKKRSPSGPHKYSKIRNTLLRDVTLKDIPLELRDSAISICDRMEEEVRMKRRYRTEDIGSQISLQKEDPRVMSNSPSTESLCSEKDALLK